MSAIVLPATVLIGVLVFLVVLIRHAKRKQLAMAGTAGATAPKRSAVRNVTWVVLYILGLALGFVLMRQL